MRSPTASSGDDEGRPCQRRGTATCAELMLETPGHFLADARALRSGLQIEALAADDELRRGVLYAALPMKCLGAPAAPADVARLAAAVVASGEKARSSRRRTAKVAAVVAPLKVLEAVAAAASVGALAISRVRRS